MSRAHVAQFTGSPLPTRRGITRSISVWLAVTTLAGLGTYACATTVLHTVSQRQHATPDASVLLVAAAVGAVACPWVWVVATSTVLDHLRGRDLSNAGVVRRAVLLACGAAVAFSTHPAHAHVLDGLPFPDRASNPDAAAHVSSPATPAPAEPRQAPVASHSSSPATSGDETWEDTRSAVPTDVTTNVHVVRPGDSLWRIAATQAATPSTTTQDPVVVGALVTTLHETNRDIIGSDPDLLHPGQELTLPTADPLPGSPSNEVSR